jgi:hypothetical protein
MNRCPYCGLEPRDDYPVEFRCGSVLNQNRSRACLVREVGQLRDHVKRLEEAGDRLADWHLSVVTTHETAKRHVERWNQAKEANL